MENEITGWDIFFIILGAVLILALLTLLILPYSQDFNPFKLMFGNVSDYTLIESSGFRDTNILVGLLGEEDPQAYPIRINEADSFEYLDEKEKKPIFKDYNTYDLWIEAYNMPQFSERSIEIYGPFGVEVGLTPITLEGAEQELLSFIESTYPNALFIPHYTANHTEGISISAIDLSASVVVLEKYNGAGYEALATVSGNTWKKILDRNNGIALLRNPDGTLIFGGGEYRLTLSLKQVQIDNLDGTPKLKIKTPKTVLYTFNVNAHECSNGILIANNASENMDIQLNVINDENVVCYDAESKVTVGDKLNIGISISEERYRKLLGTMARNGLSVSLDIYRHDPVTDQYVLLESREILNLYSLLMNQTVLFEGESYRTGRYKIVMNYDSWLDHIAQDYEYYFIFDNGGGAE